MGGVGKFESCWREILNELDKFFGPVRSAANITYIIIRDVNIFVGCKVHLLNFP